MDGFPGKHKPEPARIGVEWVTTYQAVCHTCNQLLGEVTTKEKEAQGLVDRHLGIYHDHEAEVLSSN